MSEKLLIALYGLPFSGKTTLAKQLAGRLPATMLAYDWTWARVKPPAQVPELDNTAEWNEVMDIVYGEIRDELHQGHSVVFDHINHTRRDRNRLHTLAREAGAKAAIVYMDVPIELTKQRRASNQLTQERFDVTSPNLAKVYQAWEAPAPDEQLIVYYPAMPIEKLIAEINRLKFTG